MGRTNAHLNSAKINKEDEFYTRYEDIEKEMEHYTEHLKAKVVYCPCDDYRWSNFVNYFKDNYDRLGLKGLIASNYDIGQGAYVYEYDGKSGVVRRLEGNGDFRSAECIEFLKEADVVVTNPPFSLFREYVKQLMDYGKKFLVIGSMNAITYKEIFPYIKNDELWLGNQNVKEFRSPNGETKKFGNILWYTNIQHKKRNTPLDLYKRYSNEYPKYDNYDAIEVSKVSDIPMDYDGVMGVPITFLDKYCPEQFEIVKFRKGDDYKDLAVNGKTPYFRILIKRKLFCE